ncbi:MAG: ABC transporter substrate-binding protein [Pseudomonadota bacterium]
MRVALAAVLAIGFGGAAIADSPAQRIVSLDYCSDQFVLKLLPRSRILAVSPDAERHFSYMRDSADGIAQVRPVAEDVLIIGPDLIVRSYGGGAHAAKFFEHAGVPVLQVPYAGTIGEIRSAIAFLANELGVSERGKDVIATMDDRLKRVQNKSKPKSVLYMTPSGVTSGPGTLVHEMLLAAGLTNFESQPGWRSIPLERMAYEQPDMVAAAFFSVDTNHPAMWSPMRHPVAKRQLRDRPTVMLEGAWTSCGGWFLLDAIEALAGVSAQMK